MFLNPLLLFGMALGSVPIIIHLLNKRRFRPVTWAAMEFLLQAIQKNARRLQMRDLILMLIRMLAILCLALALSRPAVKSQGVLGAGTKTGAVILIDNSLSMGYSLSMDKDRKDSRFETGKKLAYNVMEQLGQGAWCGIYTFNSATHAPMGDPSTELDLLKRELDRSVPQSDGGTNIESALLQAKEVFDKNREFKLANREIYIITDMQARAWNPRETSASFKGLLKELSQSASIYLINAGDTGTENVGIVELAANDTLASVDMPVKFTVKVRNFGQKDVAGLPVDFFADPADRNKLTARSTLDIPFGETASVQFEAKFSSGGDHKVEVRIPDDRLPGDNSRYCTIEVVDESRILLVDGREQRADDPLSNETGFLRFAVAPRDPENPEKQGTVVAETVPQNRFGDKNLLNYQVVVLGNVSRIEPATANMLAERVRAGMGLLIFLGDQTDPATFNNSLGENGARLLPAKIGAAWGEVPGLGESKAVATSFATGGDKLSHRIMAEFNSAEVGPEYLTSLKVYRAFDLDLPAQDESVRVVAWLANGKPAIVEKSMGSGSVLLFAFPATTAWTNLPTQPGGIFTILMLRSVQTLTLGNRLPKNLQVADPIRMALSAADKEVAVRISPPQPSATRETRPEQSADKRWFFDFSDTEKAGFYDVVLERAQKVNLAYAVNPDAENESTLETVLPEQIKQYYPEFEFNYIAKSDDFSARLAGERRGTELWPWLIGMVFLLLALESVLANRWAPRD